MFEIVVFLNLFNVWTKNFNLDLLSLYYILTKSISCDMVTTYLKFLSFGNILYRIKLHDLNCENIKRKFIFAKISNYRNKKKQQQNRKLPLSWRVLKRFLYITQIWDGPLPKTKKNQTTTKEKISEKKNYTKGQLCLTHDKINFI